jgi:hypothetical protein
MDLPVCTIFRNGYRLYLVLYRLISTVPEGEKIGEAVGIPRKDAWHVTEDNVIYVKNTKFVERK